MARKINIEYNGFEIHGENIFRQYLGALYCCPTSVLFQAPSSLSTGPVDKRRYSARDSAEDYPDSATCLISISSGDWRTQHNYDGYNSNVVLRVSQFSTPVKSQQAIRQVFCRRLLLGKRPAATTGSSGDTNTGACGTKPDLDIQGIIDALSHLYEGLSVVSSPQSSIITDDPNGGGDEHDGTAISQEAKHVRKRDKRPSAEPGKSATPCRRLHAGLVPLLSPLVNSDKGVFLVFDCLPFRLTAVNQIFDGLRGAAALGRRHRDSVDLLIRFLLYQLLRVLDFLHTRGVTVGNLSSSNVLLTRRLWVQIAPSIPGLVAARDDPPVGSETYGIRPTASWSVSPRPRPLPRPHPPHDDGPPSATSVTAPRHHRSGFAASDPSPLLLSSSSSSSDHLEVMEESFAGGDGSPGASSAAARVAGEGLPRRGLAALLSLHQQRFPGEDIPITYRWVKGMVSNLEYLLAVNAAAGRLLGDRSRHPIVPWVSDLTSPLDPRDEGGSDGKSERAGFTGRGWRDLTMTKFRLKKGDAQLDNSYSEARPPHHVPESLSELTLTVYLARRLPLQVLKGVVRSNLVPQEYPSSVTRMFAWTPDECIPEFYTDPSVFRSSHGDGDGLPDLEVPAWCNNSPEDFVRYHRSLLESDRVSRGLHRWLDLTFGYCLKGQAAVDNKNVPLSISKGDGTGSSAGRGFTLSDKDPGFVQLFRHPHPPRRVEISAVSEVSMGSSIRVAGVATASGPSMVFAEGKGHGAGCWQNPDSGTRSSAGDSLGGPAPAGSSPVSVLESIERAHEEGKGGGASIFGVAFDDYIGEDGMITSDPVVSATGVYGSRGAQDEMGRDGDLGRSDKRARVEEERRALAFAHDVDLRLDPWYGRSRGALPSTWPASPATPHGDSTVEGRLCDNSKPWHANGGDGRGGTKEADLLACGCILAEICAGEPVMSGPTFAEEDGQSDSGGRSWRGLGSWLDATMDLPRALRGAIGALTHVDPSKRPSAQALLATAEPGHSKLNSRSDEGEQAGVSRASSIPSYEGLFPPYMRDVYAFVAALHQEETDQERLLLAAAALPVLHLPIHGFSLLLPHLVVLLEPSSWTESTGRRRRTPRGRNAPNASAQPDSDQGRRCRQEQGDDTMASASCSKSPGPVPTVGQPLDSVDNASPAAQNAYPEVTEEEAAETTAKIARAWIAVVGLSAARLGPTLALETLLPRVISSLEGLQSPRIACQLMAAGLWGVLARRFGNGPFLRLVFPLLLAWVDRGVEGDTLVDKGVDRDKDLGSSADAGDGGAVSDEADGSGGGVGGLLDVTGSSVAYGGRGDRLITAGAQVPDARVERYADVSLEGSGEGDRGRQASTRSSSDGDVDRRSSSADWRRTRGEGCERRGRRGEGGSGMPVELEVACRVQVDAAASVSHELFECLGPALAARYLVPAMVDCLGRLATTAVSEAAAAVTSFEHPPSPKPGASSTPHPNPETPPLMELEHCKLSPEAKAAKARTEGHTIPKYRPKRGSGGRDVRPSGGDHASRALLWECRRRQREDDTGDVDPGTGSGGGESSILLISRALVDLCLVINTEEVTVPLVLSRVFSQILPILEPVLSQRGGPSASATGFRSVLEVTSLLSRLLPSLCPETIAHFYVGLCFSHPLPHPQTPTLTSTPAAMPPALDIAAPAQRDELDKSGRSDHGSAVMAVEAAPANVDSGVNLSLATDGIVGAVLSSGRRVAATAVAVATTMMTGGETRNEEGLTSVPWLFLSIPLPEPVDDVDSRWTASGACLDDDLLSSDDDESTWETLHGGFDKDGDGIRRGRAYNLDAGGVPDDAEVGVSWKGDGPLGEETGDAVIVLDAGKGRPGRPVVTVASSPGELQASAVVARDVHTTSIHTGSTRSESSDGEMRAPAPAAVEVAGRPDVNRASNPRSVSPGQAVALRPGQHEVDDVRAYDSEDRPVMATALGGERTAEKTSGVDEEVEADLSLRFVCHVEVARLLAVTAMRVVDFGGTEEEENVLLQTGEVFFSAFNRLYGGLMCSSPTMVAALKLAREVHSPLASLFGLGVMRERVPSASRRMVRWLSRHVGVETASFLAGGAGGDHLRKAPGGGGDDVDSSRSVMLQRVGAPRSVILASDAGTPASLALGESRLGDEGQVAAGDGDSGRQAQARNAAPVTHPLEGPCDETAANVTSKQREPASGAIQQASGSDLTKALKATETVESKGHPQMETGEALKGDSERERALGEFAREGRNIIQGASTAQGPPQLLARFQQTLRQLAIESTVTATASFRRHLLPDSVPSAAVNSETRNPPQKKHGEIPAGIVKKADGTAMGGAEDPNAGRGRRLDSVDAESSPWNSRRGVPAWGPGSADEADVLLPPPTSTLPPRRRHRSRRRDERDVAKTRDGTGGGGAGWRAEDIRRRNADQSCIADGSGARGIDSGAGRGETDVESLQDGSGLEWPSLLGAMGSRTPMSPQSTGSPALSSTARELSPPPLSSSPEGASLGAMTAGTGASSHLSRRDISAGMSAGSGVTPATQSHFSPPQSPHLHPLTVPPHPPLPALCSAPATMRQLPPTCYGVGVEVPRRLQDRAWLVGTRSWGDAEEGHSQNGRPRRILGHGFETQSVGALFPLGMVLQTSFVAHANKVAVTSLAIEPRSEAILLSGSNEGEVRVWCLRNHPATRLSGFRCGGATTGGGIAGGVGDDGAKWHGWKYSRQQRAVTQVGLFEGGARGAALNGLVRVWDIERSKGLAICRRGTARACSPLTAFALAGCENSTIPPLDSSEWDDPQLSEGGNMALTSAADDQQLSATYEGGVVHYDLRQGVRGATPESLSPVLQWSAEPHLDSLRLLSTKGQAHHGGHGDSHAQNRRGGADPHTGVPGFCSMCEGEGDWLAAGSGGGQAVVFDKRRPGGRPIFWWNAHDGAIVGIFRVSRHRLLTVSRDLTAILWDLSRSPSSDLAGVDSFYGSIGYRTSWDLERNSAVHAGGKTTGGASASKDAFVSSTSSSASPSGLYGEVPPVRVSMSFGLPDNFPGLLPSTVTMIPMGVPDGDATRMFGGQSGGGSWDATRSKPVAGAGDRDEGTVPVLFAAAGDGMVASVVRDKEGLAEEVYPSTFVGPSGRRVYSGSSRRSSSGGFIVRSTAVLPLRRLLLLGCTDGRIRVGT